MLPRLAVRSVIIQDRRILLAHYRGGGQEWYVVPGGGVEEGETIPEAFGRETREECGQALEMGELLFVREIMADRHETNLPKGFHQVELYFRSALPAESDLRMIEPDENQVGLEWIDLETLSELDFYPKGMTNSFVNEDWPRNYTGEMR
jgi:8-oxo-dGTP diphosphatase